MEQVAAFFAPACFGLLAVHEHGLVHRDIKPGNIMVVTGMPLGSEQSIKVVDFGIAKHASRESGEIQALTATGEIFGSPLYMSPEQCTGGDIDHRSDIYSLGCVLFEMLTGTPPYFGQSALTTMMLHESGKLPTLKEASLGQEFPEALEEVVAKMLRKSPAERYQNIGLVAHDLAAVCKGGDIASRRATAETKPEIKSSKTITIAANKLYALLAVAALIPSTLAWIGGYAFKQSQTSTPVPLQSNSSNGQHIAVESPVTNSTSVLKETNRLAANRRLIEASGPIKASIVNRDGMQQRMYVFPECGIGMLLCYKHSNSGSSDPQELCQAKGTTYVPLDCDLMLKLSTVDSVPALQTPSIFGKISGKEFRALYLSSASEENITAVSEEPAHSSPSKNIATILMNVYSWPGLEAITLKDCTLRAPAFAALNRLKVLRSIILDNCSFEPRELARQPFLIHLESVNITALGPDGDYVVRQLAHSSAINELRLVAFNGSISPSAIEQLQLCPNLRTLGIRFKQTKTDDQFIKAVCQLKHVRGLTLYEVVLNTAQIKMLSKCPWFTTIVLSKEGYPDAEIREQIKKIDPRIVYI